MFGFGKKTRKVMNEVKKMEKRDDVEATVWGAMAIAFADGEADAAELTTLEKTIAAKPAFAPFAGEISTMSSNARQQFEASRRSAKAEAIRQLKDVAGTDAAVDVLCLCLDIADNGGIGPEEEKVLGEIAQALGLNLNQYL
ncbi:tellurite resistance TerB family protein [Enterobacter hormaechei]|uniref:tellurite resistance TerB family protein n=1 Tax=Enterobacter hormaechei TaxID=158836 RepID=UPI0034D15AFD